MRKSVAIITAAMLLVSSLSAFDPYQAATGYRRPYHSHVESHMPGRTLEKVISSTHDLDYGRARLVSVLYLYAYLADNPSEFGYDEREFVSSLLHDMRDVISGLDLTYEEDRAIRRFAESIEHLPGRYTSWTDIRLIVQETFPRLVDAIGRR